jgi:2-dehydro-3-deoxy-D-arabinonate dehydratase
MSAALFRLRLADGSVRLAGGDSEAGPERLLPVGLTIAGLLTEGADALHDACLQVGEPVPAGATVAAPVDEQEIWAAGVTYERSREARVDESQTAASAYDRVYEAERPELFFKAAGWRVRGPGEPIGIRADSGWDVPEPELALVLTSELSIAGYTIGNDVSSRSIEGENPLYLPQAKVYDGSCALGPCIVPAGAVEPPFPIRLSISRDGATVVAAETTSARLRRSPEELAAFVGRALTFPSGVVLLTGTGIVPGSDFSLAAGDLVRIEIGELGVLENRVEVVGRED